MTTWTMGQVRQARGFRAQAEIDADLLDRDPRAWDDVRSHLAKNVRRYAHPFVIEVDPEDLRFSKTPGEKDWLPIKVLCWWEPTDRPLELRGGRLDGDVLTYRDAPDAPFMVPEPTSPVLSISTSPADPWEDPPRALRYECTGWDETERRWVYTRT